MKGFVGARQTTLAEEITLTGTGVHSGAPVTITLYPADADTGVRFLVANSGEEGVEIEADHRAVSNVTLCTVLTQAGHSVSTVEHLMAAIRALGLDNVLIEIDAPEVPIMDGSSAPFVDAIDEAGLIELNAPRRYLKVLKPIRVEDGASFAEFAPHNGFRIDVEIAFDHEVIGTQRI
jgi:UDP-3-O-[3-hydroxymyristoyl] N-acetylglucosamine deacetylase